ncbi:uncharacterized protein LOC116013149 [Ipomoea triloba]|uniref:uncharacterized protein LOC116013149 n=1 Tax=Ipomoea triloba TaxID=35885 RepID=UPI00125DD5DE|nr:uncharacterized protein LOC116013149 [Ipomoea triloba]
MGMYSLASELSTFKNRSAIKVRVIRSYLVREKKGSSDIKSQELVLHDPEGAVIHATIPAKIVPKFIHSFVEGKVYGIKNFYVVSNWHTYKTSMHEYMMQFNHETIFKELRSENFHWYMYRLRSFDSLKGNSELNEKELIDIIGRVVEVYGPQEKNIGGNNARLIDFVLEDAHGKKLTCTFWGDHVSKIQHLYEAPSKDLVIVLIQFCRIKRGLKDGEVKICSSYDVTQVLFNLDYPEFINFRDSLTDIGYQTPMRSIASLSSFSFTNTMDESSSKSMELITINEIYDNDKYGDFWVATRIQGIVNPTDWFYSSCRKPGCYKKLKISEGVNKCFKCFQIWEIGILRYKITLRVVDIKGNASFLLWDRECQELIGIPATELYEKSNKTNQPLQQITELVGKTLLFQITTKSDHTSHRNTPFPVLRINNDPQVLKEHCSQLLQLQDNECNSNMQISLGDDDFLEGILSDEAESPIASMPPVAVGDATEGPVKRCLLDQFSSTQSGKKHKETKVKYLASKRTEEKHYGYHRRLHP